jgi:hypothetical protein
MFCYKKFKIYFLTFFMFFYWASVLDAQMSSTIQQPTSIEPLKPVEQKKAPSQEARHHKIPLPTETAKILNYFHPGVLVYEAGQWQGTDHLLNLTNQIGVYVEVLRPGDDKLGISEEKIQSQVASLFNSAGVKPMTVGLADQPPLPAFQIKIFLYPIDRGYAAYCEGRLFESVNLKRFDLDPGMAFEAITWERQSLIVAPTDKTIELIDKQVNEIVSSFLEIFQFFDKSKGAYMK